jgi:hypothetical protein
MLKEILEELLTDYWTLKGYKNVKILEVREEHLMVLGTFSHGKNQDERQGFNITIHVILAFLYRQIKKKKG